MKWITRERPKIDRIACPWLIKRFIDQDAEIIYVPSDEVIAKAKELDATPFDVPGVEFTHYQDQCTFDYFIQKYNIKDPAVLAMAPIVRGADTDHHEIAPQASGLWAISAGLAYNTPTDEELLQKGMMLYDALYSWAKHLQQVRHTQNPTEHLLLEVFHQFIEQRAKGKKVPVWAKELKEMIQDQLDTNLTLKELSKDLQIHPAYMSREFAKHFDNLSFGDYLRKLRIDKALSLLQSTTYSLTEIAYLTGFSDQSHFTRTFKQHMGVSPSAYKKSLSKSNTGTKG